MSCDNPITVWRSKTGRDPITGKWPIVFDRSKGYEDMQLEIPCGRCRGCRLERSRQWAIRCVHEASLWPHNCFVTLTYDDDHLPPGGTLVKRDVQLFLKRLRKRFSGQKIRFYMCGEYGELRSRPHYHIIFFNLDFPDKYLSPHKSRKRSFSLARKFPIYESEILNELWPYGIATIGGVTFETCAYTARYIMKKITGDIAESYYQGRLPEYNCMSRKPGIAHDWYQSWKDDVYPHDYVVIRNGLKCRPPRYYDHLFELEDEKEFTKIKWRRKYKASKNPDNTYERRQVRITVRDAKLTKLIRPLEIINNKLKLD